MKHILSIVLITFLLISCGNKEDVSNDLSMLNAQKEVLKKQLDSIGSKLQLVEEAISKLDTLKKLAVVTTISPEIKEFNHYLEVQGTVMADKSVELHPEMGGTVTNIYVKEGQQVSKGQILAQLDASILNNNIAQMQTQMSLVNTAFERQSRLWEQKIGSEMQYLQAKAEKEGLESNLKALKSQARQMKIIAPFSGTIDEVFAKQGTLANPQVPFLRIINLSEVYLESEVTETYLKDIKKGTTVIINFPSLEKEITSKISQVGNYINPGNRSFKTRIDISNPNNEIKANQLADVKINDFLAKGIVISSQLIQKDRDGNSFVYTIKKEGSLDKVFKTLIKVSKEYNNQSYVSEGLTENDLIIDKGSRTVKSNDEVLIAQ